MNISKKQKVVLLVAALTLLGVVTYSNADYFLTSTLSTKTVNDVVKKAQGQIKKLTNIFSTGEAPVKPDSPKDQLKNAAVEQLPKLIDYAGSKVPEDLVTLYKGTDLKQTVKSTAETLGKLVVSGKITDTEFEASIRDVFGTAVTDTATFANGLMDKYNLKNIAVTLAKDPTNSKAITEAVKEELKAYAEQEINKLANQAIGKLFPVLEGVELDFTNLNAKSLKASMRSMIINAMAQSYLGPQYVAVYMIVSTVCPKCMVAAHAELRRFDKNYIQPATDKIADEWDRFEDRLKASSAKFGQQVSAEIERLKNRVSAELNRQKEQVVNEAKRAEEKMQAELKRAQDSKVGIEIQRQLNDISAASAKVLNKAENEAKREFDDVNKEANRLGKRADAELKREVTDAKNALRLDITKVSGSLAQKVKSISGEAQKIKAKIDAELKRVADQVQAEAQRLADKAKAELNRAKETVKNWGKKLKCC